MKFSGLQKLIDIVRDKKPKMFDITGENNILEIDKTADIKDFKIYIFGDNNKISIGKNVRLQGELNIGAEWSNKCNDCIFEVGQSTTTGSLFVTVMESATTVEIGKDCMFAPNVKIWASDTHSIVKDGKVINKGKKVHIGNHCWLGTDTKIGKSVHISDNSIVSWGSVVYGKFDEENVVIGGNPANIYKRGIDWDRKSPEAWEKGKK